jgi:hypothetical protein
MITPSIQYQAAVRTLATAAGPPRRRFPLPQTSPIQFAAYAFDQELEMLLANYPPAPKNTPSNATSGGNPVFAGLSDSNAILTKLSQPSATSGGKGKFTASFVSVPASWDDFQMMQVTFPAWKGYINGNILLAAQTRQQVNSNVMVRIHHDYFVIDPAGILTGADVLDSGGGAIKIVTSKGAIPDVLRQKFLSIESGVVFLYPDPKDLVPSTGLIDSQGNYSIPTIPSVSSYQGWCAVAAALSGTWDATHPPAWDGATDAGTYGQWCWRDSTLPDYEGNIVDRQSFYVLAR